MSQTVGAASLSLISSMDTKITAAAIEVGSFIATKVALDYCVKVWGVVKTLRLAFATSCLVCLSIALPSIWGIAHQGALWTARSLIVIGALLILAVIYAVACWSGWKQKPFATAWGVAASLTYILLSLFTIWWRIHRSRTIRGSSGLWLAIGVVGLVALLRRDDQQEPIRNW